MYHYDEKGNITLIVSLYKRCDDVLNYSQMIYAEECLVLVNGGDLTVLHRQSYYKKCVIRVSHIVRKVRRVNRDQWKGLLCIDGEGVISRIDVDSRKVEVLSSVKLTL